MPDRHHRAHREQPEGREHRPDVARPAIAQPVLDVGRLHGLARTDQQEHLVAGVRPGVRGLGQHRGGPGDDGSDRLGDRDQQVRAERDDDDQETLATCCCGVL